MMKIAFKDDITTQIKFLISEYVRKNGNHSAPVGLQEKFNTLNERLFQDAAFEVKNFSVAQFLDDENAFKDDIF